MTAGWVRNARRLAFVAGVAAVWGAALLAPRPAEAVPTLQLFLPDGVYAESRTIDGVTVTQSWLTLSNPFNLTVAGATSPEFVTQITDVTLWFAIRPVDFNSAPAASTVSVTLEDGTTVVKTKSDFAFGIPDPLVPHGIFPTWYAGVSLPVLDVAGAGETVFDYNAGFDPADPFASGSDSGDLQLLSIEYSPEFFYVHLDLSGIAHNADGTKTKAVRAPFSHDADAPLGVAEPGTLAVFATGLLILAAAGRRRVKLASRRKSGGRGWD